MLKKDKCITPKECMAIEVQQHRFIRNVYGTEQRGRGICLRITDEVLNKVTKDINKTEDCGIDTSAIDSSQGILADKASSKEHQSVIDKYVNK